MLKLIDFSSHLYQKKFNEQVLPYLYQVDSNFEKIRIGDEAVLIFEKDEYLFTFLRFASANSQTSSPTFYDSLIKKTTYPRITTGEWIVDKTFEVPVENVLVMMQLYNLHKEKGETNVIQFFRDYITKCLNFG
jgi:hypothetical protein